MTSLSNPSPFSFSFGATNPQNSSLNQQQQQTAANSAGFGFASQPNQFASSSSAPQFSLNASNPLSQSSNSNSSSSSSSRFERRLLSLRDSLDPNSRDNKFQFAFYNRFQTIPADANASARTLIKPAHVSDQLWSNAIQNNPDQNNLFPVIAVGFADLQKRFNEQLKAASQFQTAMNTIGNSFNEMNHVHESITKDLLSTIRREFAIQSHRLLVIHNRLELSRASGIPLLPEELEFRRLMENLDRKLSKPGQFLPRSRELAANARLIREKSDANALFRQNSSRSSSNAMAEEKLLNEGNSANLYNYLKGQTESLEFLTNTAQQDELSLKAIREFTAAQEREKEKERVRFQ